MASMTAKQFFQKIVQFSTQLGGSGRQTGYVINQIYQKGQELFTSYTADENAPIVKYDPEYNPVTHENYINITQTATTIKQTGEGWFGITFNEDVTGTSMGKEVDKKVMQRMKLYNTPAKVYGGCSAKAMLEILEIKDVAMDADVWVNIATAAGGGTVTWDAIAEIAALDTEGWGPDIGYGASAISKGAADFGFDPCNPSNFNQSNYETYVKNTAEAVFKSVWKGEIVEQIKDDNTGVFGGMNEDDEKNFMEGMVQAGKEIEAYSRVGNIQFKEQCFLLSNVQVLSQVKQKLEADVPKSKPDNTAKGNACVQLQGDPFGLINKLTQNAHKEEFFEMPTAALSSLQPMIRLYKVIADESGKNERQVEIKFDSHYSPDDAKDLLTNKKQRGHGVGISSFNFSYEANNPYAIKKSIKAKLVIHANSFTELLRDRPGTLMYDEGFDKNKNWQKSKLGGTETFRYIDLALKTWSPSNPPDKINPKEADVVQKNMDKLTFRLKAVVGWANPSAQRTKSGRSSWAEATGGRITPNILDAIYDSCITVNLTPTVHTFDIDEMGRVKFTLNYLAYIEDFFDAPSFNIFTKPDVVAKQLVRKVRYKKMNDTCDSKELNEIKNSEAAKDTIEDEKIQNFRHLMSSMIEQKAMRFMEVPIEDLSAYRAGGPLKPIDPALVQKFMASVKAAGPLQGAAIDAEVTAKGEKVKEDKKKTTDPKDPGDKEKDKAKSGSTGTSPTAAEIDSALNPLQTVTFFWISDLMDVILKNIGTTISELPAKLKEAQAVADTSYKEYIAEEVHDYNRYASNFARFRLALGPIELINANKKGKLMETAFVNFGDIPISAKYFMEFLTTKVLKTDRQAYPLPKFLNDFFNELIRDFLNNDTCYGNRAKQKTRLSQASITSFKKSPPLDNITAAMGSAGRLDITNYTKDKLPILEVMGERGSPVSSKDIKDETNFLIFFAARTQPTEQQVGCKHAPCTHPVTGEDAGLGDHEKGIWHYQIGKDRGIVKSIQLEKTDSPGLAEVRFEQEGYDGLAQLRVMYDAKITTYLDVNAYPGSYIYIEPRGFDPAADSKVMTTMGIGGYYMIIRSSHTIGPGVAETEITAKWVAQIDSAAEQAAAKKKEDEKPTEKKSKCYAGTDRKMAAAMVGGTLAAAETAEELLKAKDDGTKKPKTE
jgi:hypothetical protein